MADPVWTEARIERLKTLYAEGLSFSVIAAKLGLASRSAAIGKAHRLGLVRPAQPKGKDASIPQMKKPAKQRLRAGDIARKATSKAIERQTSFVALADKALERFDAAVSAARPNGDTGVLFLDRSLFQCSMPMPGWDDLPVTEKRVCGRPVVASETLRSYCAACSAIVYQPARLREFKLRQTVRGIAA